MTSKLYCRLYQTGIKIGNCFVGYRTPETIEGPGCIRDLPEKIRAQGVTHVFLVCGPHIARSGLTDGLTSALDAAGVRWTMFSSLQANPTDENVEAGLSALQQAGCDGMIAFGGGSVMDCAKAIAARNANPNKTVEQMQGLMKAHKKILPFWAVPTTAGTGSETTVAAVITVAETKHKASISDSALLPKWAVLDPELTVGMSPFTTATTGMDALCHAVEAYTNWRLCTATEKYLARRAVKLIYENIERAYSDGSDLEARQNMQLAAFYAGRTFTRACVGYVHACGHPLSALYGLPHGLVMGTLLPHVMRRYGSRAWKRLSELADVCGLGGADEQQKAMAFLDWIEQANRRMGLPTGFSEIRPEDIPQMAEWADKEACPLYPVPRIWSKKQLQSFYEMLLAEGGGAPAPSTVPPTPVVAEIPVELPAVVVEEAPVAEPAPVVETVPVEEPAPVVEEAPIPEPASVVEEAPITEPAPVIEEAPVAEPAPAVEAVPIAEPVPAVEEAPVAEPAPVVEEAPVAEPAPVVEPDPAEEPAAE